MRSKDNKPLPITTQFSDPTIQKHINKQKNFLNRNHQSMQQKTLERRYQKYLAEKVQQQADMTEIAQKIKSQETTYTRQVNALILKEINQAALSQTEAALKQTTARTISDFFANKITQINEKYDQVMRQISETEHEIKQLDIAIAEQQFNYHHLSVEQSQQQVNYRTLLHTEEKQARIVAQTDTYYHARARSLANLKETYKLAADENPQAAADIIRTYWKHEAESIVEENDALAHKIATQKEVLASLLAALDETTDEATQKTLQAKIKTTQQAIQSNEFDAEMMSYAQIGAFQAIDNEPARYEQLTSKTARTRANMAKQQEQLDHVNHDLIAVQEKIAAIETAQKLQHENIVRHQAQRHELNQTLAELKQEAHALLLQSEALKKSNNIAMKKHIYPHLNAGEVKKMNGLEKGIKQLNQQIKDIEQAILTTSDTSARAKLLNQKHKKQQRVKKLEQTHAALASKGTLCPDAPANVTGAKRTKRKLR